MTDVNAEVMQAIEACHVTETELLTLLEDVLDGPIVPSTDTVSNIIIGIMELNRARVNRVEWEYRQSITGQYVDDSRPADDRVFFTRDEMMGSVMAFGNGHANPKLVEEWVDTIFKI